jgi:NAD-dependent deacetylase
MYGAKNLTLTSQRTLVLTGAGISAESGVPTFRGTAGLWKSFRPEDLATPEAFQRDPRLCWEWYAWRRDLVAACRPNPAHLALASWLLRRPGGVLVTQNVDGLHELAAQEVAGAGDPTAALPIRLHGSIFRARCTRCGASGEYRQVINASSIDALPRCQGCTGLLRPDVVWFGEMLPELEITRATLAAAEADLCLVIGTRGAVYPAAGLVHEARRSGARVIVVDPEPTDLDHLADIKLSGKAGEILPGIL